MKIINSLILVCGVFVTTSVMAKETVGLGVVLGAPTGLSFNYMLSSEHSIDAALAFDLTEDNSIHIHTTYLWRYPKTLRIENAHLGWYWGVGGRFKSREDKNKFDDDDEYRLGARGSAGLNYFFHFPLELFAEVALIMNVLPKTGVDADAGIGARYYF